jgi:hypothetical protein
VPAQDLAAAREPRAGPPDLASITTVIVNADGTVTTGDLAPAEHRRLHLQMLHGDTDGYVEIASGDRPPYGKLALTSRTSPDHFHQGGAAGGQWLEPILAFVEQLDKHGKEVCVAPAMRNTPAGGKPAVHATNWLWIDVDGADGLPALWSFFEQPTATLEHGRLPHLVLESGGSGGAHAYWRLTEPLLALYETPKGDTIEWIERANLRLIHALGHRFDAAGKQIPTVADLNCKDRSRVMRLAGTRNYKTGPEGRHARIVFADLQRPAYHLRDLVGDLPDPKNRRITRRPTRLDKRTGDDEYRQIPAAEYFDRLFGIDVPDGGRKVRCPAPDHEDKGPSCKADGLLFYCFGCGVGGSIYDAASLAIGGPTGQDMNKDQFQRAAAHVKRVFGGA